MEYHLILVAALTIPLVTVLVVLAAVKLSGKDGRRVRIMEERIVEMRRELEELSKEQQKRVSEALEQLKKE